MAPKPRNPSEVRVCGDYRQANIAIKRERHPIPTVDEVMENMAGATKYSKISSNTSRKTLAIDHNFYYTQRTFSV